MARGNYGPEIRQSIDNPVPRKSVPQRSPNSGGAKPAAKPDSPAEIAADTKAGIKQNSPQDIAMDAGPMRPGGGMQGGPPASGGGNPAHAAMAASIAHAILQRGG
jgi:hypothetical protein